MDYKTVKTPLIVDPDREFLKKVEAEAKSLGERCLVAHDFESALEVINEDKAWISSLVVNPTLGPDLISKLIAQSFEKIFGAPIFFITDKPSSKKQNEARAMTTNQVLEKPVTYRQILDWVQPKIASSDRSGKAPGSRSRKVTGLDADFAPIGAKQLIIDSTLSMDVYVKLRENRYVRVVNAGDALEDKRLQRYLNHGLQEFHLKKIEHDNYKRTCEHLSLMLSAAPIEAETGGEPAPEPKAS